MLMRISGIVFVCACLPTLSLAQPGAPSNTDMQKVMERLDRLEKQNAELLSEVRELRQEISTVHEPAAASQTSPAARAATGSCARATPRRSATWPAGSSSCR